MNDNRKILSGLLILILFFALILPEPANAWGFSDFFESVVDTVVCVVESIFGDGCGGGGGGGSFWGVLVTPIANPTVVPLPANYISPKNSLNVICPADQKLCGTEYCIPKDAVCCQSVGFPDKYCEAGYACTTDGQCQKDGDQACSDLSGKNCVSGANSCGQTDVAKYLCDGSCFATPPPDSSCPSPTITLSTLKAFTDKGKPCTIKWSTTDATSCTLTGPGLSVSGTSGQVDTPPLQETSTYTLSCQNGPVVTASQQVICYLTPHFEEF